MNAGTLVLIGRDGVDLLQRKGILLADGTVNESKLDTLQEDLELATGVEDILKAHGVNVPGRVDQVIRLLPVIVSILG